jgi:Ni/Co efflux regulator RcnB
MRRNHLRRPLAWCLAATILLPAVLALLLGLGRLLAALGDVSGATACDRIALLAAVLWAVSVVATTIVNAALLVQAGAEPASPWDRLRPGMRDWRRSRAWSRRRRRSRALSRRRRRGPRHRVPDNRRFDEGRFDERHHDQEESGPGAMP